MKTVTQLEASTQMLDRQEYIAVTLASEASLREAYNVANSAEPPPPGPIAIRTRYCACSYNSETDCRFHSRTEPGWEVCPELGEQIVGAAKNGRWLWITSGEPANQDDPTEAQDKAAEERLSKELIRSVS